MVFTNYNDIANNLPEQGVSYEEIKFGDDVIRVLQYLPIQGKVDLLQYVINMSMDEMTGCFSPTRVNVYYCIGLMRAYCGIHFDDEVDILEAYDTLESSGIMGQVVKAIPEDEKEYMISLINDTIEDITRYNTSFAGVIQAMTDKTNGLDKQLQDILSKVKDREGLELLGEIKNVVGTD